MSVVRGETDEGGGTPRASCSGVMCVDVALMALRPSII
jgi:hypothetical protein